MQIYFEDGELKPEVRATIYADHKIDGKNGFRQNERALDEYNKIYKNQTVRIYTNSLVALSNVYCWNNELQVPELYIRPWFGAKDFVRVDKLTSRMLREGHNLLRMYMANEFGNL